MEGRAPPRPYQGFAWIVPLFALVAAANVHQHQDAGRAPYAVLGVAGGAAWQLLDRRDLAARLTWPVVFAGAALVLALAANEPLVLGDTAAQTQGRLIFAFGVLSGLVLTEDVLRWRDGRAARLSPEEGPATTRGTARP
ncbi:hypothetical protein FHP29_15350 [Nocardioides albidus]|uniref:Uncharacterized protein n=1 Tax=Nocardioides albidus TaxID=1517589 RepID=A0A5C4VRW8_9ACTN|nr:hypothetical protein [Nocardioides albidus]TNM38603.1 hypothetical protein FHP29_15350 [Nocardioides albidus]